MMERLASHLASTISQCNRNPSEWSPLEACLHALKVSNFQCTIAINQIVFNS